jgi:DNA polymerase elongation subunit (family B)
MKRFRGLALDIETTGLDPDQDQVLTAALVDPFGVSTVLNGLDEELILRGLEDAIDGWGCSLATWNGGGFDLPFLAERYRQHGLFTTLCIKPTGATSKYGGPEYDGSWGCCKHRDIAPEYKLVAAELGVRWSLKPVAQAVLGVQPIEVDVAGGAQNLHPAIRAAYCLSDAGVTWALADHQEAA